MAKANTLRYLNKKEDNCFALVTYVSLRNRIVHRSIVLCETYYIFHCIRVMIFTGPLLSGGPLLSEAGGGGEGRRYFWDSIRK